MVNHDELHRRVQILKAALAALGDPKPLNELSIVIKRPGWTTPAELFFASAIVDSMLEHVNLLANLKDNLLKGAGRTGNKT